LHSKGADAGQLCVLEDRCSDRFTTVQIYTGTGTKTIGHVCSARQGKPNDVSEQYVSFALGGAQAASVLTNWFADLPATNAHVSNESGTLIRCADVLNVARYQWLCPADKAAAAWVSLAQLQPTNTADWNLSEIQAASRTNQLTQEKFVPQMINFELVGGVNFKKAAIRVRRSLPAASIWANSNAA
jgi:hypothetical protein